MFHGVQISVKFVNQAQASNANISAGDFLVLTLLLLKFALCVFITYISIRRVYRMLQRYLANFASAVFQLRKVLGLVNITHCVV